MTTKPDYSDGLLEALKAGISEPEGEHLSGFAMADYVCGRLSEEELNQLDRHLAACAPCAAELEYLFDEDEASEREGNGTLAAPPIEASPLIQPAAVLSPSARRVTFAPYHPRDGKARPGCVAPIEVMAKREWAGISFDEPVHRAFGKAFPAGEIVDGNCKLLVTTPLSAMLRYQTHRDWRVVVPLALAPQQTRIVVNKRLRRPPTLMSLGGRRFAIADRTSVHAMRLTRLAVQRAHKVIVTDRPGRDKETVYLVPMAFSKMVSALKQGEVDGIATVEPIAMLATVSLGPDYDDFTIEENIVQLGRFCCVVVAPSELVESPEYQSAFRALVDALFRTVCGFLKEDVHRPEHEYAAAKMMAGLAQDVAMNPGDRPSELLAVRLIPDPKLADIDTELGSVQSLLPPNVVRMIRDGQQSMIENPLYDVAELRRICVHAIERELPWTQEKVSSPPAPETARASAAQGGTTFSNELLRIGDDLSINGPPN